MGRPHANEFRIGLSGGHWFGPKICCDLRKLVQCGLEILDDLRGYLVRRRQVVGIFEAFIAQPEDVEIHLVAFD